MIEVKVPVIFQGTVTVQVPDGISAESRQHLARNHAMAHLVADVDAAQADCNMVKEMCNDFVESTGCTEDDWDNTESQSIGGTWEVAEAPENVVVEKTDGGETRKED